MDEVTIHGFDNLVDYLRRSDLSSKQVAQIVNEALKVWFIGDYSKQELIDELVKYWHKWGHIKERPLFIMDDPLDV